MGKYHRCMSKELKKLKGTNKARHTSGLKTAILICKLQAPKKKKKRKRN